MSRLTLVEYEKKWRTCKQCPLHKGAAKHVLYRGSVPADILFIGEAPGKTENKLGRPFVGRSGNLLNKMLETLEVRSFCIANVVCCIPWKRSEGGGHQLEEVRPPSKEEAAACAPHLDELTRLVNPQLIVFLGKEAEKHYTIPINKNIELVATLSLRHPAYILRQGGELSLEYKRCLHALHQALMENNITHKAPPKHPLGVSL